jgi:hypothetical protein
LGFDHLRVSALAGRKPFSWSPAEAGIIPTAALLIVSDLY